MSATQHSCTYPTLAQLGLINTQRLLPFTFFFEAVAISDSHAFHLQFLTILISVTTVVARKSGHTKKLKKKRN